MNKNWKTGLIIVGFMVIIGGIIYLIFENLKLKKRVIVIEDDRLRIQRILLEKYSNDGSDEVVVKEIDVLIFLYTGNKKVVANLKRAKELCLEGHREESVRKLVVAIENLLKDKLEMENDTWYQPLSDKKKKFVKLNDLFNRAKTIGLFNDLEHSLAISAAGIRNGESHQVGYEAEDSKNFIGIFGSIEIIKKLQPQPVLQTIS